jgi:hypothetical protein
MASPMTSSRGLLPSPPGLGAPDPPASVVVASFRPVGIMRRYERGPDGRWHDGLLMDLLPEDLTEPTGRLQPTVHNPDRMLRCRPTPPPRSSAACSHPLALLGSAGRARPASIAVRCPTGLPSGVATDPAAAVGVGGWPASQHRSDRLDLLLRKVAASLTAQ